MLEQKYYVPYIAGPMTGLPNYNFDAFHSCEEMLRKTTLRKGHKTVPVNPASNFGGNQDLPRRMYLARALQQVARSHALVLLPGWASSEGAGLEVTTALDVGIQDFWLARPAGDQWVFDPVEPERVQELLEAADRRQAAYQAAAYQPGGAVEWPAPPGSEADEKQSVAMEAEELVNGPRLQLYGHPRGDFDRVAGMWSGFLLEKLSEPITGEDVAALMIAFKLARLAQTPDHHDSLVDVVGYALCMEKLLNYEEAT